MDQQNKQATWFPYQKPLEVMHKFAKAYNKKPKLRSKTKKRVQSNGAKDRVKVFFFY